MSEQHHHHTPADWDARYSSSDRIWSGRPNSSLVDEVSDLAPGRALDVGCGEGADAVWLARQGWQVSALDPSSVALERARQAAAEAGVDISWWLGQLRDTDLPLESFDLVSSFYAPLPIEHEPIERLKSLVAPGGTLLIVHHVDFPGTHADRTGNPAVMLSPALAAEILSGDNAWTLRVNETRGRAGKGGPGTFHGDDYVVKAVRSA